MKVVIELKDSTYEAIKNEYCIISPQKGLLKILWEAIQNGVVLPKGHGKLIDVSNILTVTEIRSDGSEHTFVPYSEIEEAATIIEADRSEE